jgi:hypothetical protein
VISIIDNAREKAFRAVNHELIRYARIQEFSTSNIWRMKQFYETYRENEKLATLLLELTWSHNLLIMPCKTEEEHEFYLMLSIKNCYSFRELKRQ